MVRKTAFLKNKLRFLIFWIMSGHVMFYRHIKIYKPNLMSFCLILNKVQKLLFRYERRECSIQENLTFNFCTHKKQMCIRDSSMAYIHAKPPTSLVLLKCKSNCLVRQTLPLFCSCIQKVVCYMLGCICLYTKDVAKKL